MFINVECNQRLDKRGWARDVVRIKNTDTTLSFINGLNQFIEKCKKPGVNAGQHAALLEDGFAIDGNRLATIIEQGFDEWIGWINQARAGAGLGTANWHCAYDIDFCAYHGAQTFNFDSSDNTD